MSEDDISEAVARKHLLFGIHGFNNSLREGAVAMAAFEQQLNLGSGATFFGILWPGDAWLPYVNYPFEADDAVECGKRLALLCNKRFGDAESFSFMSHSLGGRLALEAVKRLDRRVRMLCLMAAAVDRDVLTGQYREVVGKTDNIHILSSPKDMALRLAYPAGDFLSDLFGDSDSPFRTALGLRGPRPSAGPTVGDNRIPRSPACNHSGYMPGGSHWHEVPGYVRRCFERSTHDWPAAH